MGKPSRDKGKRGELEVVKALQAYGFDAGRNYDQSNPDALAIDVKTDVRGIDGLHIQVKRHETLHLPAWIEQAENEAPDDSIPIVVYRRSYPKVPCEWQADLSLANLLPLLRAWTETVNRTTGVGI